MVITMWLVSTLNMNTLGVTLSHIVSIIHKDAKSTFFFKITILMQNDNIIQNTYFTITKNVIT